MSIGESFFRVLAALGGWIIAGTTLLVVAIVPQAILPEDRPETLWLGTMVLGVAGGVAVVLTRLGDEHRRALRWISLPVVLLAALAASAVWPYLAGTTIGGIPVVDVHAGRDGTGAALWQRAWAPVQMVVIVGALAQGLRTWRRA